MNDDPRRDAARMSHAWTLFAQRRYAEVRSAVSDVLAAEPEHVGALVLFGCGALDRQSRVERSGRPKAGARRSRCS